MKRNSNQDHPLRVQLATPLRRLGKHSSPASRRSSPERLVNIVCPSASSKGKQHGKKCKTVTQALRKNLSNSFAEIKTPQMRQPLRVDTRLHAKPSNTSFEQFYTSGNPAGNNPKILTPQEHLNLTPNKIQSLARSRTRSGRPRSAIVNKSFTQQALANLMRPDLNVMYQTQQKVTDVNQTQILSARSKSRKSSSRGRSSSEIPKRGRKMKKAKK